MRRKGVIHRPSYGRHCILYIGFGKRVCRVIHRYMPVPKRGRLGCLFQVMAYLFYLALVSLFTRLVCCVLSLSFLYGHAPRLALLAPPPCCAFRSKSGSRYIFRSSYSPNTSSQKETKLNLRTCPAHIACFDAPSKSSSGGSGLAANSISGSLLIRWNRNLPPVRSVILKI